MVLGAALVAIAQGTTSATTVPGTEPPSTEPAGTEPTGTGVVVAARSSSAADATSDVVDGELEGFAGTTPFGAITPEFIALPV